MRYLSLNRLLRSWPLSFPNPGGITVSRDTLSAGCHGFPFGQTSSESNIQFLVDRLALKGGAVNLTRPGQTYPPLYYRGITFSISQLGPHLRLTGGEAGQPEGEG